MTMHFKRAGELPETQDADAMTEAARSAPRYVAVTGPVTGSPSNDCEGELRKFSERDTTIYLFRLPDPPSKKGRKDG